MRAINIEWDTDDYDKDTITTDFINMSADDLPTEMEIPDGMMDVEEISDWLSDETGFCHKGFELVDQRNGAGK